MALETLKTYYSKKSLNLNNNNYYFYNNYNTENDNCNYKFFSSTIGSQCHEMTVLENYNENHTELDAKKEGPNPTPNGQPRPQEREWLIYNHNYN